MSKRSFYTFLRGIIGVILCGFYISLQATPQKNPNIIIIHIDDLGWADVSCYASQYGEVYIETPNIDNLASSGIRFTNGYANCTVCSPSRVSLLTGRYPTRSGLTNHLLAAGGEKEFYGNAKSEVLCPGHSNNMPLEDVTIAEVLKPLGYKTCHIGKWHVAKSKDCFPPNQGFDVNIAQITGGRPGKGYHAPYEYGNLKSEPGSYLTYQLTEEANKFIEDTHNANEPFFLHFCHYGVHEPLKEQGPDDLKEKYQNKKIPERYSQVKLIIDYAAITEAVDRSVGQVIAKLEELNIRNNTLIIFTSDNGGFMRGTVNWPLRGAKGSPYEGGIREPWIVSWPGVIKAGRTCEVPIMGIDVLPTICDIVGTALPKGREIDGVSIWPVIQRTKELAVRSLFWHYPHYRSSNLPPHSIIRDGDWKLIRYYAGEREYELFNLKDDLSEENNLALEEGGIVLNLDKKLSTWLDETGAKFPVKNPDYNLGTKME